MGTDKPTEQHLRETVACVPRQTTGRSVALRFMTEDSELGARVAIGRLHNHFATSEFTPYALCRGETAKGDKELGLACIHHAVAEVCGGEPGAINGGGASLFYGAASPERGEDVSLEG